MGSATGLRAPPTAAGSAGRQLRPKRRCPRRPARNGCDRADRCRTKRGHKCRAGVFALSGGERVERVAHHHRALLRVPRRSGAVPTPTATWHENRATTSEGQGMIVKWSALRGPMMRRQRPFGATGAAASVCHARVKNESHGRNGSNLGSNASKQRKPMARLGEQCCRKQRLSGPVTWFHSGYIGNPVVVR